MLSAWLRVIRIRFLLSSVIAVSVGLVINWWQTNQVDFLHSALTFGGVLALHASVDLLNDYWDFKRGIDLQTQRTKISGGTGVLPEGLLEPSQVYKAGILSLVLGSLIGSYFIIIDGVIIAILLAFAVLSIYFYSTKIVDSGLAEFFVAVKGIVIVLGTYFIQSSQITPTSIMGGIVIGVLSSLVLFITSFPDHDADKAKGRRTLVILLGRKKATNVYWAFPAICYVMIGAGVAFEIFPTFCLIVFLTLPILLKGGKSLKHSFDDIQKLLPIMNYTLLYSRLTGLLFVLSFIFSGLYKLPQ
jgi:1,4-dihydroxy-2-naphthoate octaprenyltransferase